MERSGECERVRRKRVNSGESETERKKHGDKGTGKEGAVVMIKPFV